MARRKNYSGIVFMPESRFLDVECKKCQNKQTVFSKSATLVDCEKCGENLVAPMGGHAWIKARIVRVLR